MSNHPPERSAVGGVGDQAVPDHSLEGLVFDLQRFCLHDGPGIRTVLFLKGCSLRCSWCCNPESQSSEMEVLFDARRCIGCGKCVDACPDHAIIAPPSLERVDRTRCRLHGACAAVCPTGALRVAGTHVSVEWALAETTRDRNYYEISGGGVTISGGEPLLQAEFTTALLTALKRQRVHTAVETAGCVAWDAFERTRPLTDLYLFDIKHVDDARHLAGTGQGNSLILQNLRRLAAAGATIQVRYVLLPGYNMDDRALEGVAELVRELPRVELELLPFHRLGAGKYVELGRRSAWRETSPLPPDQLYAVRDRLALLVGRNVRA